MLDDRTFKRLVFASSSAAHGFDRVAFARACYAEGQRDAQERIAELERDAARYRWLRGDSCPDHSVRWTQWEVRCWRAPFWTDDLRRTDLDEEINAAMRKEGGE